MDDRTDARMRELERDVNLRLTETARDIARIDGVYEERTRNLEQSDRDMREDFIRVEGKLDQLAEKVTRAGVYISLGAALGAALLSAAIRLLFG